jgi:hypothetical protein
LNTSLTARKFTHNQHLLIMENIVMRYFREIYGYIPAEITHCLGISAEEYLCIETEGQLLFKRLAEQLLFNAHKGFLLKSTEHLSLLLTRNANVNNQKEHQLCAATGPRHLKWDIVSRLPHIENTFTLTPNLLPIC